MNYVLVKREGDWWLGKIKDIKEDEFFIDFMSPAVAASWIHTRHIWLHHPLLHYNYTQPSSVSVQVAVRQNDHGPYVFRSGTLLRPRMTNEFRSFYYVVLDNQNQSGLVRCNVVRSFQIIERLPSPHEAPICGLRSSPRLVWVKRVIPFDKAFLIQANLSHLKNCVSYSQSNGGTTAYPSHILSNAQFLKNERRMYVRVDNDTVTFIFLEQHSNSPGESAVCQEETLHRRCAEYYRQCVKVEGANRMPAAGIRLTFNKFDSQTETINGLPLPVLENVLLGLDLFDRFRAKRVCALWQDVLARPAADRHLFIDTHQIQKFEVSSSRQLDYVFAVLLEESITIHTRTVSYISSFCDDFSKHTAHLLSLKAVKLDRLVIKGGYDWVGIWHHQPVAAESSFDWTCNCLKEFFPLCQQLILVKYTLSGVLQTPYRMQFGVTHNPYYKMCIEWHEDIAHRELFLDVVVSRLTIDCNGSKSQILRAILMASETSFPFVGYAVYERVAAVYQRMLLTLTYPDDWADIRILLQIYNGFWPDGTARNWNDVDLRKLDVTRLTKMTLHVLDAVFRL
ncbi:uncharacterized protein LOC129597880 [Paramacrobiotus metropolitanus]|uniref:uncharacterized protein LOC129597880 n=1 Tax=Paramacrobiotus metropolitanus TaxID=2943436 RepID=UPI002445C9F3|nr:uncharacterized protein LOC129597880 [Paramacrobiotus metropolitanus]